MPFGSRHQFDCTEVAVDRVTHEFFAKVLKDKCQDQLLEGLVEVFQLVLLVRLLKPMPVYNKEHSKVFDQDEGLKNKLVILDKESWRERTGSY